MLETQFSWWGRVSEKRVVWGTVNEWRARIYGAGDLQVQLEGQRCRRRTRYLCSVPLCLRSRVNATLPCKPGARPRVLGPHPSRPPRLSASPAARRCQEGRSSDRTQQPPPYPKPSSSTMTLDTVCKIRRLCRKRVHWRTVSVAGLDLMHLNSTVSGTVTDFSLGLLEWEDDPS